MTPPRIAPVPGGRASRPFWSVMIPSYNARPALLEQALQSVLDQDGPEDEMQIEVVDDCSPNGPPAELVQRMGGGRVQLSTTPTNLGLAGCWNHCISRARGTWVHILHQDDYVLPGFYAKLRALAVRHPEVALLASRSFYVDEQNIINGVSRRVPELEAGGRSVEVFFNGTHIQCPGIAVRRSFYELHGGFLPGLVFVLDCEMWARAVAEGGGVVTPDVLSCYRISSDSATGRLARTAETLRDTARMNQLFSQRYPSFPLREAERELCQQAAAQAQKFQQIGDREAVAANIAYWNSFAPLKLRLRRPIVRVLRSIFR